MGLKDLLVHIDATPQSRARLQCAANLASAHDAHLIGLYVVTHPDVPPFIRAQLGDDVLQAQHDAAVKAAKDAEAMFEEITSAAGLTGPEWRCVEGEFFDVVSLHARYVDVVVMGQEDPEGSAIPGAGGMPDRLILGAGRPVLVVPYVGDYPKVGEHAMVAWDGSRLSTRAVNDALPLLTQAKKVSVMAVNPQGGSNGHGDLPGADICLHLARHGVKAEAQHVFADDVDVADMLLSRAADESIDLFVMGAYGHARWRELVLGGVTRHMLRHMTMPVLMSH